MENQIVILLLSINLVFLSFIVLWQRLVIARLYEDAATRFNNLNKIMTDLTANLDNLKATKT